MSTARGNLKMAMGDLKKAKWRSALTMLGIIIGIASVVTVVGLGEGIKQQVTQQVGHFGKDLIMVHPGKIVQSGNSLFANNALLFDRASLSSFTSRDYETAKNVPGVGTAALLGIVPGTVAGSDGTRLHSGMVIATSSDLSAVLNQPMRFGSFFEDNSTTPSAVIGQQIAYDLFGQNAPLGKTFTFRGQTFLVRGVFSQFDAPPLSPAANFDDSIFIPYLVADQLTSNTTQYYTILAKPSDPKNVQGTITNLTNNLKIAHGGEEDFSVLDEQQSIDMGGGVVDLMTTFTSIVAGICLFVGGIGIMNIMLVSVTERMHEIGVRKAIGATNRQILNQFMLESTVLSVFGGILGIGLSFLINLLLHAYTSYRPVISWRAVVLAAGISVAVGIIFGTAPAFKAARKDPIDALRHE